MSKIQQQNKHFWTSIWPPSLMLTPIFSQKPTSQLIKTQLIPYPKFLRSTSQCELPLLKRSQTFFSESFFGIPKSSFSWGSLVQNPSFTPTIYPPLPFFQLTYAGIDWTAAAASDFTTSSLTPVSCKRKVDPFQGSKVFLMIGLLGGQSFSQAFCSWRCFEISIFIPLMF